MAAAERQQAHQHSIMFELHLNELSGNHFFYSPLREGMPMPKAGAFGLLTWSFIGLAAVAITLNPVGAIAPLLPLIAGGVLLATLLASGGERSHNRLSDSETGELRIPPVPDLRPEKAPMPGIGDDAGQEAGRRFQADLERGRQASRGYVR